MQSFTYTNHLTWLRNPMTASAVPAFASSNQESMDLVIPNYFLTSIITFPKLELVKREPKLSKQLSTPWQILSLELIFPSFMQLSISFAKSPKRFKCEPTKNPSILTSLPTILSRFLTPCLSVQICIKQTSWKLKYIMVTCYIAVCVFAEMKM